MSPCLQQHWPFAGRRQTVRGGLSLLSACRVLSLLLLLLPVAAGCLLCEPAVAQDGLLIPQDSPAIAPVPDFVPPEPPGSASSEPPERTPDILEMPFSPQTPADIFAEPTPRLETAAPPQDVPRGYTGATGIRPSEQQQTLDFVPVEDRWRMGFPDKDRYRDGNPRGDDRFGELGHWWDPYNQNVLKGDYPIIGQHTFLNVTATNFMLHEFRKTPTGTSPFESTVGPGQQELEELSKEQTV